jgi:hypothetical protein
MASIPQYFSKIAVNYLKEVETSRNNWQVLLIILHVTPSFGDGEIAYQFPKRIEVLSAETDLQKFPPQHVWARHFFETWDVLYF